MAVSSREVGDVADVDADDGRLYFTASNALEPGALPTSSTLLIADSWLLVDGAARALECHERRFFDSCMELIPELDRELVASFLSAVRVVLPREGCWFPRIEAHIGSQPQLALWLREAPETADQTRLWLAPEPDPRLRPLLKGPDLQTLAALRERATAAGADDAMLSAPDGSALEAAHSAVVWWRGETLCVPDVKGSILPSITRSLLLERARDLGVEVRNEMLATAELPPLETWTLNALHGIRGVSAWHGDGAPPLGAPCGGPRARELSLVLAELRTPIDDAPRW